MIILNGPTGSGKTSILKELNKLGFTVIPTYSTRPARNDDYDVKCISQKEMDKLFLQDKIFSFVSYETKYGHCEYCILKKDIKENLRHKVIIGNKIFNQDIREYVDYSKMVYVTFFLDVDYKTIVETTGNSNTTNKDRLDRLKRDFSLMKKLKYEADIIINNNQRKKSPSNIAQEIITIYNNILRIKSLQIR